jgi:hypothetical protein
MSSPVCSKLVDSGTDASRQTIGRPEGAHCPTALGLLSASPVSGGGGYRRTRKREKAK